jgi:subtilisin family serine protease
MSANTVLKAYLAYLGRPPDQSGMSFYGNAAPTAAVAAIASSSEAGAMLFSRASDTPREQVDGVYTHLFGRLADPDGASYWVGELQAGRLSSEQLPLAVLNSAQNQDALVISNKLKVIDAFVAQLSNPNFGTAYGGNSAATSLRGLIADVGSDDSSLQAALSLVERAVSLIVANKDVAKTGSPLSTDNPGGLVSLYTLQASSFASNKMTELAGLDAFVADARFSGITGKGQTIAIIDSSFDLDHPAFGPDANGDGVADRIVYHADFTPERNGANTVDTAEDKHGTHVASIAAGQLSEARGIAPGANLILLQGLQEKGGGSNGDLQQALQWVVKNAAFYNIVAVNNSWGGDSNVDVESTTFFGDELSALIQLGVVPTVAAGNSYEEYQALGVGSPADDTFALGVSSSNGSVKVLSEFSQRSEKLSDIVAPGSNVLGASSGGGVISLSGTSMAAPVVAGSVALAQELAQSTLGRRLTVAEVYQVLQSSASRFIDGEIATDAVKNTGANFRHLDIKAMGEAILALGGGGNGSIGGGGGNDSIGGGSGNDSTSGGGGNDSIGGDDDNPYLDRLVGAIGITAGQTVSGELETAGEPDFFAVNLSAGNIYEIALTGDTLDDPYLRVFNPDGSLLGEDDDGNDGLNSVLNLNIQRTGRYYVSADSSLGSETGTYSLEISAGTAAPAGGVRSFSVASNDKVVAGEIAFGGELNRHTIELNTGRLYTFSLRGADSGVGTLPDPYLELFQNDSLIVFSDDGGVGLDSRINFIPSTSVSYTLVASGYSLTESGSYTLQIGSQVYSGPPEIPGNKSTQASLAVAGSVSGNVDYQGDEDWFRVDLQAGNQYSFSLSGLPDSLLKLFDSSGDFVAFDDDGGGGTDSLLRFAPTSNGTYYIAASVYGNLDTGSYSLGMSSQVATSETVSSVRDAGVLGLGTTVNGVLASEAGYDVYTIALSPARYRITVLPGAGQDPLEDPVIFVDEDRFFLDGLFDDDGGTELDSLLEFSPTKAVNAIIAVGGYDAGAYTLLIQPL